MTARARVVLGVDVKQAPNHALVLRAVFARFVFEKLNATFAQSDRYLYAFVAENQVFRMWQKITNDLGFSDGFIGVFYFPAHIFVYLFANNLHRKYGSCRSGM